MRNIASALTLIVAAVFMWTAAAKSAGIEPVGKVSVEAGAEKEEGYNAGARGSLTLLGVMPLAGDFGLQAKANYTGGFGSRASLSAGPIFGWDSGKAGLFLAYQYRTFNSNSFVYLRPSVAFYLPQANINLYYSHPISDPHHDGRPFINRRVEVGTNYLATTFNYFPGFDIASFMTKDNVEFTLGVQVNSFGGAGSGDIRNGVGPMFGFALMPAKGWEINVVKGFIDHQGRYKVLSGVSFYFDKIGASLKALRRRYLEPNMDPTNVGGKRQRQRVSAPG